MPSDQAQTLSGYSDFIPTLLSFGLISTVVIFFWQYWKSQFPRNAPPSPFVLPLLGNLLSLSGGDIFETFKRLRKRHGDVFSVYIGQELMVVLNGYECINDALVKNGKAFMCRPNKAFNHLVIRNPGIVYADSQTWKEQKDFALTALKKFGYSPRNGVALEDTIQMEVCALKEKLLSECNGCIDLKEILSTSAANVVSQIIFGKRFEFCDETFSGILSNMNEITRLAAKANSLLNSFPWLIRLPGDVLKIRRMRNLIDVTSGFYTHLYRERHETHGREGMDDFMGLYIDRIHENEQNMEDAKNSFTPQRLLSIQRELLTGGGDTVSTVLLWIILYLVKYPDIQSRLQEDIDAVVGSGRVPELADRVRLPFVEATIMESLRISKVLPFAVPHSVLTDTPFRGYTIPKNTTVLINLESVLMDPSVWDEPELFNPQRFLDEQGHLLKPKEFIPFSLGPRSCVGETLAVKELFLYVACLMQELRFLVPEGAIPPSTEGTLGFTFSPKPFLVQVQRRRVKGQRVP